MPTYTCMVPAGLLDAGRRQALAAAISSAHAEATGAPRSFAQVVFDEKQAGTRFLGGEASDRHVFVRGDVRAGRTTEQRAALLRAIVTDVTAITGVARTDVWVYLGELAPNDMVEYGHVLPEPGGERAWLDGLPQPLRERLDAGERERGAG